VTDSIEPFRVAVPDEDLADLRRRLEATRFPDQIPGTGWELGTELAYAKELVAYWRDEFDWRAAEARLNAFEQFRTTIDGQRIHFIHARSPHPGAHPLLISHGWPGSVAEFLKVIGPLVDPESHGGSAADAFHVVVPSLPGFGFSDPTRERGWTSGRIADAFAVLMSRLGYTRYGAQGGDWGAVITTELAVRDAEHLSGIHLNMPLAMPPRGEDAVELSDAEKATLAEAAQWQKEETGYQKIQGTRPQTLGFGLNDSPAGLAAWLAEKFRAWMDCEGEIERVISKDELLCNIAIYWFTRTITSSTRIYYETFNGGDLPIRNQRIEVPTGCAIFPKEPIRFPRSWVECSYAVTHWSEMERGGHFAALEQPEMFVEDVRAFYRGLR